MQELKPEDDPIRWFYDRIDRSVLSISTEEEMEPLVQLGLVSLLLGIRSYYQSPEQLERIRKRYLASLEVLKHGVLN